jgi:hypothetical protein
MSTKATSHQLLVMASLTNKNVVVIGQQELKDVCLGMMATVAVFMFQQTKVQSCHTL